MSKNIDLKRTVFDKTKFNETVNTDFTQLQSELDPQFFDLNLTHKASNIESMEIKNNKYYQKIQN